MTKANKSLDFQKKKGHAVEVGRLKNKSVGINNKKQKNKKNKQIQGGNGTVKQHKQQSSSESIGLEASTAPSKKVPVDETVVTQILSNPEISKKKLKKKIGQTRSEPSQSIKSNVVSEEVGEDSQEIDAVSSTKVVDEVVVINPKKKSKKKVAQAPLESSPTTKTKKRKNIVKDEGDDEENIAEEEDDAVNEKQSKLDKKRKKAITASDEIGVQIEKDVENDSESKGDDKIKANPLVSVFVGNLPINTKRGKILKLFSKFGKVKSIRFRLSNGGKFFKSQSKVTSPNVIAFVDFESVEDAKSSLVLNGEKIKDNVIRVNLQSIAKTADSFDGKRTVFVGNLKYYQNLHDLFSCCGDIEYARTMQCEKGCNGIGYVCFKKSESVSMALELNNSELQGRPVRVQRYVKKSPGGPKEKKIKKEKPTGAVRRIDKKKKVKKFGKDDQPKNKNKQFAGMKAKDKKKKAFVKKNKKPLKGPKLLAKKIASHEKPSLTA